MIKDFTDFPTLEEAKKGIEKLKTTNWPDFNDFKNTEEYLKAVEKIIYSHFSILPDTKRLFDNNQFNLPIFRVRELDTFTNINLFSEHSYPPLNVTNFGRCNFPHNPVFYCSNNPMTALMEVVRETNYKKRKFCVSRWEVPNDEGKLSFQNFLLSKLDKKNNFNLLKDSDFESITKLFESKLDENRKSGFIELLKFMNESFINDKKYHLSATLAYRTLFAKHNLATDILMYPSIQTKFKGVNMAIHPNFVDNVLKIKRFYILELQSFDTNSGEFNITFRKYGYIDKNVIMWRNIKPDDSRYKKYINDDFGGLMKRDFEWNFEPKE